MANDTGSGKSAADIAFDECVYDRKYLLLSVPDFDVDPVEGEGSRRMTSYLRLGTVPDDWKSLPGAELELAVHADYGLGGGSEGLPIAQVVPGEVLPTDPKDARYLPPTLENLTAMFVEEVRAACVEAHALPAVARWAEEERARVASSQKLLDDNQAGGDAAAMPPGGAREGSAAPDASFVSDQAPTLPGAVLAEDFVRFLVVESDSVESTLETRLQGVALGSPVSPLDDQGAAAAVGAMNLKGLVELVLRRCAPDEAPWTIQATTPFASALVALVAAAAQRAGVRLAAMLKDSPDALLEDGKTPKYSPFVDDQRYRGEAGKEGEPDDAGFYISHDERHKHSKHLHTRGGWRDHSDGNRITTTYGDKIEVIRGNYKLMVLGRQGGPGASNIVDYSGQITQSDDNMLLRVEWVQDDEVFNWETVNENIVESEKKSGRAFSWWYGPEKIDVTGSDDPVEPTPQNPLGRNADKLSRANPEITSRTWARWIKDYTGSSKLPVGSTYSETWVDETEEKTTVTRGTIETTTVGGGTISTTTVGGATMETTTVGAGTVSTTTVGAGTMEMTTVGGAAIALTAIGGAQVEITGVVGAIVGVTASLANIELSAHAVHLEAAVVGVHADFKVTGIEIELSATGLKIEGSVSGKEIDISPEEDETMIIKKQTYGSYTRTTSIDVLNYTTSSETGTSKNLSLSALRVVAASISLG